ncbi:glycosyltransferase family 4 protein [Knoellia sp. 3-2P3]|uniref:glycosyltransferase family 4 protein n=1 Tax=unclassified Knoellia TaxID=2618719 RepID=UPI0023DA3FE5|nr:glycosyltransferase family 4 protein [Knoellia sp. 3-2P3]MDF2093368.1 glycosyltransferase family 4 protein [Knoellia sp. 3-2P3]
MRVAYVCADPGVPVFGTKGSSIHVQEVLRQLARRGVQLTLWCARTGGAPAAGLEEVEVRCLPPAGGGPPAQREEQQRSTDLELAARLGEGPRVDLVYERYSLWGTAGMRHASLLGVPGLLEVNAPLVEEQARHRQLVDRDGALARAGAVFALARSVLCVSEPVASWVREVAPGARTVVLPNGVDPARFTPGPEPAGPFTVGFVGTLKPWHGVDVLVRAVALLDGVRLRVIGDGPEREALERLAVRLLGAHRADFVGAVPPRQLPAELARLHVAAAPYPVADTYFSPLKVFEYLAAGLPVVASRSGQLSQLLADGVDGLLTPAGDVVALAAAIARLRSEPELRVRLGRAARHTAQRHTWEAVVDASLASAGLPLRPPAPVVV